MTAPMTPERLAEIRARAEAATCAAGDDWRAELTWSSGDRLAWTVGPLIEAYAEEVAEFIAAARTDVPDLLAEVERVRAEALEPVLALHRATKAPGEPEVCIECHKLEYEPAHWPCRTVRAITAAREARP